MVNDRTTGYGCPVCAGHRVLAGHNDFASTYPQLAHEWDRFKNVLGPDKFSSQSNKRVWWLCSEGHTWEAAVASRANGQRCPFCAGKRVLVGFNDLASVNPKLASEWHPSANDRFPSDVTGSSSYRARWRCALNHEWVASVNSRASGRDCAVCANKVVLAGFNDLEAMNSELASAWHPTKNRKKPSEVTPKSGFSAWWLCAACGKEWRASVDSRAGGNGCPKCAADGASLVERLLFELLTMRLDDVEHNSRVRLQWRKRKVAELDVSGCFEGLRVAVEYDGEQWHKSGAQRDADKTSALLDADFLVIRVRSGSLAHLDMSHPNLKQLDYRQRFGRGAPEKLKVSLEPLVNEIMKFVRSRVSESTVQAAGALSYDGTGNRA